MLSPELITTFGEVRKGPNLKEEVIMRNLNGSPVTLALVMVILAVITCCTAVSNTGPLQAADLCLHAVLIVEVMPNAPGDSPADEIPNESITLLNNTPVAIDLLRVEISDGEGSWAIPSSIGNTILGPGGKLTVKGSMYNPNSSSRGISLLNAGEYLALAYGARQLDRWRYPPSEAEGETVRWQDPPPPVVPGSDMRITFWGAARETQGSCYQIRVGGSDIVVDCGSFTNSGEHDNQVFEFVPSQIDGVIITDSHANHCGGLHYMFYQGYVGTVYMTEVTAELYLAQLDDTIQSSSIPDQDKESVKSAIRESIHEVKYSSPVTVSDGITATFLNAGHIPGSASIFLNIETDNEVCHLLFPGDTGP